jgi:hypothetical protein
MTEIRSYRRVFDLERRVYSIDRLRLNPTGIPVRGIVYLLAAVCLVLALSSLPGVGAMIGVIPWYLRDLGVPALVATVVALVRIDGRTFHLAALSLVRHRLGARTVCGLASRSGGGDVWLPPPLVMLPDGSDGRFRALRYEGPGAALVLREHRREGLAEQAGVGLGRRGSVLRLTSDGRRRPLASGTIIALARGGRLEVVADSPRRPDEPGLRRRRLAG